MVERVGEDVRRAEKEEINGTELKEETEGKEKEK